MVPFLPMRQSIYTVKPCGAFRAARFASEGAAIDWVIMLFCCAAATIANRSDAVPRDKCALF